MLDDENERSQVIAILEFVGANPPFAKTSRHLTDQKVPLYEQNPADPEGVIRVDPDGSPQWVLAEPMSSYHSPATAVPAQTSARRPECSLVAH